MADTEMLTPRQKEIYIFIRSKIQGRGYGPTVREIGLEFHIKSPNGVMCHLKALQKKGLIHREPNMSRAIQLLDDPTTAPRATGLKMVGRIAAGQPIEAIEQDEELEFGDWEGAEDKFALRVTGNSMIDEHIADGDFVIIRKQETAENGERVVAMINDEVTLKRFFRDKEAVRLEPANGAMKPIIADPNEVKILGILVGVMRRC
jgi:repressor LexA